MHTRDFWIVIGVIILVLLGVWYLLSIRTAETTLTDTPAATVPADEAQVRAVVTDFGAKLKNVSLTAAKAEAAAAIAANYSADVDPVLLARWENDPSGAPGRLTSSPWPDRIEISAVTRQADGSYLVDGMVIEKTSVEEANGGASDTYPMQLTVNLISGKWLITDVQAGPVTLRTTPDKG